MANNADTLIVAGVLGSAWADWDDGVAAYAAGDYATAYRSWFPDAEQGDAKAQFNLGIMYYEGTGVPENDTEAVKWYRMAAEQGDVSAQYNLGNMYGKGEGVPEDYVKAYMWWLLAKAQGDKEAAGNLDIVKKRMNTAQIGKAQALASEWWENHN